MSLKGIWDNKVVILAVTSILGGASYGGKVINDAAFEKGVNQERNKNLEKYEQSLKDNNKVLIELIALRIHCKQCCPNGCDDTYR